MLGLSLAKSAVFSLLDLANALTRGSLRDQSVALNGAYSQNPVIDALYQLSIIVFSLMPVALVVYLLTREEGLKPALRRLGLQLPESRREAGGAVGLGVGLFLVLGAGTVGLYLAGRTLGLTARLEPSQLDPSVLNQVILGLSAVRHGLLEEIIMLGYLFARGRQIGWSTGTILLGSALLRALYHSYQGVGPMLGNLVMGLIFCWIYSRINRLAPFILAHVLLDLTAFLGADWYSSL